MSLAFAKGTGVMLPDRVSRYCDDCGRLTFVLGADAAALWVVCPECQAQGRHLTRREIAERVRAKWALADAGAQPWGGGGGLP